MLQLPARPPRLDWYLRRPCYWLALAAGGAAWATYRLDLAVGTWLLIAAVGCAAAAFGARAVGALISLASVYGCLAALTLAPATLTDLPEGAPVTVQGRVERLLSFSEAGTRLVFLASRRRERGAWVEDRARYGAFVPSPAAEGDLAEISGRLEDPLPATNPGDFDRRLGWLRLGVRRVVFARPGGYTRTGAVAPGPWELAASDFRRRVVSLNQSTLSPTAAFVANSFLLGDVETADPELAQQVEADFQGSGTLHLLVVSGTQVGMVLLLFLWLGGRCWEARGWWWGLGIVAIAFFHTTTGGDASVSRAAVMGALLVGALLAGRKADGANCLGAAALLLLAFQPFCFLDVGAQLSFSAVWALIWVAPALQALLGPPPRQPDADPGSYGRRVWMLASQVLSVCLAAHLVTAPLLAFHFHTGSWTAVLANCVVAPLAALFIHLVIAHAALAHLGAPLLAWPTQVGAEALTGWAHFFASSPLGAGPVYPPPLWLIPVVFGLLAVLARPPFRRAYTAALLVLLCGLTTLSDLTPAPTPSTPTVRALDIGQGDAVLLQGTDGSNVLVDAGPPTAGVALPRILRALRVKQLDAVLVSHPHLDHVGGLPRLCEEFPPREIVFWSGMEEPQPWIEARDAARRAGVSLRAVSAGERLDFGRSHLTMLGPAAQTRERSDNEVSLVAMWEDSGARVLLTGDAGLPAERELIGTGPSLRADLLKVGHHGSEGSTGEELLAAVQPRLALISCGRRNRFGHPAPGALARLNAAGVPVVRTDRAGMITIRLGHSRPTVERFRGSDAETATADLPVSSTSEAPGASQ
ncbi:MAG: ComEC [Armatimonadetes bacterium]|nr:ComEC [Armatimonadota bacterium]